MWSFAVSSASGDSTAHAGRGASFVERTRSDRAVIIGGQALQFWCDRYADADSALRLEAPFTSKDVDVQGDPKTVAHCARILGVKARMRSIDDATNIGFLETPSAGMLVGLTVLTSPFGLSARSVDEQAITVSWSGLSLRVLHPIHCMWSRIANVGGLSLARPKDMRQARASILCAKGFIAEQLALGETRNALAMIEQTFHFALRNVHGKKAFRDHGLDTFAAVDVNADEALPAIFHARRLPQMRALLLRSRTTRLVALVAGFLRGTP